MMSDVLTPEQRRFNMSRIRGKNTKPEKVLRSALHRRGLRFRLHRADLPGRPDIVLPRHRVVILVHGCFWHGHGCHLCKEPQTRTEFWVQKIASNRTRDIRAFEKLISGGWKVITVWECALRGHSGFPVSVICDRIVKALQSVSPAMLEIAGARSAKTDNDRKVRTSARRKH